MNNLVFSAIAGITSFVKSLRLRQVFMGALAGVLLLTSTACGSNSYATSPRSYDAAPNTYGANERPSNSSSPYDKSTGPKRELYKPTQSSKGGMNNYDDDPAYDRGSPQAGAKRLIDRAENRLQKRADSPEDLVGNIREQNPLVEGSRDVSRRAGDTLERAKEGITEGGSKGIQNLKANVDKTRQEVPEVFEGAKENAQSATRGIREGSQDLSEGAQRAAGRAVNETQNRASNAANAVRDRA